MIKTGREKIWARRETDHSVIWELHKNVGFGTLKIIAYIQLYPKGQTAYWFNECDKGIEGYCFGQRACDMSRALQETMTLVEKRLQ
jgi:hypothetical protein